jgi:hypothetical protein
MLRRKRAIVRMAAVLVAAGACVGMEADRAVAQLSGSDRTDFIQSSISSCTSTMQKGAPSVPLAAVTAYCTCMGNKAADMTTQADLQYLAQHGTGSDDYTNRIKALVPGCLEAAGLKK